MKTRVYKIGNTYYPEYSFGNGWWRFIDSAGLDIRFDNQQDAVTECLRREILNENSGVVWESK